MLSFSQDIDMEYGDVGFIALGKPGRVVVDVCLCLSQIGNYLPLSLSFSFLIFLYFSFFLSLLTKCAPGFCCAYAIFIPTNVIICAPQFS